MPEKRHLAELPLLLFASSLLLNVIILSRAIRSHSLFSSPENKQALPWVILKPWRQRSLRTHALHRTFPAFPIAEVTDSAWNTLFPKADITVSSAWSFHTSGVFLLLEHGVQSVVNEPDGHSWD